MNCVYILTLSGVIGVVPEVLPVKSRKPLCGSLKRHKGYTAVHGNKAPGRTGKFWQEETHDHVVRKEAGFHRIWNYILQNPVKAGLARRFGFTGRTTPPPPPTLHAPGT